MMILHVVSMRVCGDYSLCLTFNDGTSKRVNVEPLLHGQVFSPLRDPAFFAKADLDPDFGTVFWPNGADIAPEALYELADEPDSVRPEESLLR